MTIKTPSSDPQDREANLDLVETLPLNVQQIDFATLVAETVTSYNNKHASAIKEGTKTPLSVHPQQVHAVLSLKRLVLNEILTKYTNYRELCKMFYGKPGKVEACELIQIQMLDEIAATYAGLGDVAEDAVQKIIKKQDDRDAANEELLNSVSAVERFTVEDALSQEVMLDYMPFFKIVRNTVIEYSLGNHQRRLTADRQDPNNLALLHQECMKYIIRNLTNTDSLCKSYYGLPGYATAWNIIYENCLSAVAGIYPELRPIIDFHSTQPDRPWKATTTPIAWSRKDGPSGTFLFTVDKTSDLHLAELTEELDFRSGPAKAAAITIDHLTNYDAIKPAMYSNEGYDSNRPPGIRDRSALYKVRIAALQEFKKIYPQFAAPINNRINDQRNAMK